MNKLRFLALFLLVPLAISCSQIKKPVNTANVPDDKQPKIINADIPKNIQNSTPDAKADREDAVIVSILNGEKY